MCESCQPTAADRRPTRRTSKPPRILNQLAELSAIGRAMADAALVFDQSVNEFGWDADGSTQATIEATHLTDAVKRAAVLFRVVADTLAPHFPKRPNPSPDCNTDGKTLRLVAEQIDRLHEAGGHNDGLRDEREREYVREELFPHLLAERSARNPAVCPLCGGEREESVGHDEGIELRAWCCWTCNGDVRKAKRVLKAKRVNPLAKRNGKAKKATAAPKNTAAGFLPLLGVLDCRTPAEREADEAAGKAWGDVAAEVLAGTAEPLTPAPKLANRITGIA